MISIQVYLIARVCFRRNAQFLTSTSKIKIVVNNNRRKNISCESGSVENWRKITIIMSLLCNSVLFTLALRSFNTLIIDGDVKVTQALLILLKRQHVAYIIRVIGNSKIQQVSNVHVILCIHYASHK